MSIGIIQGSADNIAYHGTNKCTGEGTYYRISRSTGADRPTHSTSENGADYFAIGTAMVMTFILIARVNVIALITIAVILPVFISVTISRGPGWRISLRDRRQ